MASQVGSSGSFSNFYLDEQLTGHLLLRPSIFVADSYQRIFSKVEENGCNAVIETIKRIVLFIVLPLIAIIAACMIPVGLIFKSFASCGSSISEEANRAPEPSILREAMASLADLDKTLERITAKNIDSFIEAVRNTKTRLESNALFKELLRETSKSKDDPVQNFKDKHQILLGKISHWEYYYNFCRYGISNKGEIKVDDNGDCVFESFIVNATMSVATSETIQTERENTVKWIREAIEKQGDENETLKSLKPHLTSSLIEHKCSEIERIEAEKRNLDGINEASLSSEEVKNLHTQRLTAAKRIETLQDEIYRTCNADENFIALNKTMISNYLDEMTKKGVHGGEAELYALSCRHKVCVKIFQKKGEEIEKEPYPIMNLEFESEERPAFHFTHTSNHYDPQLPVRKISR